MRSAVNTCCFTSSPRRSSSWWFQNAALPTTAAKIIEAATRSSQAIRLERRFSARAAMILRFSLAGAGRGSIASRNSCSNSSIGSNSDSSSTYVLLQEDRGFCAQQLQSALQMALHRGQRRAESPRNLLRCQVFLIAENQRRALRLWQCGQQTLQARAQRTDTFLANRSVALINLHPPVD